MEAGYTVNESKYTSLMEDGFMPVETALEVPIQEQFKNKLLKLINADFSKSNLNIKIYYLD